MDLENKMNILLATITKLTVWQNNIFFSDLNRRLDHFKKSKNKIISLNAHMCMPVRYNIICMLLLWCVDLKIIGIGIEFKLLNSIGICPMSRPDPFVHPSNPWSPN